MDAQVQLEELLSMLTPQQFEALASSLYAQRLPGDLLDGDVTPSTLQAIAEQVWQILEGVDEAQS